MTYVVYFLGIGLLLAVIGVAVNPAPYFATGALAVAALFGSAILVWCGGLFLPVVLLLIYLGGMLVVFAYAIALVPGERAGVYGGWQVWVWVSGLVFVGFCLVELMIGVLDWGRHCISGAFGVTSLQVDLGGAGGLYTFGAWWLCMCGVCLFVCLFVVLGLSFGGGRGAVRPF
uniref:NADH-ubiquinone oxidoreductase chain 6 n=1 Tax=Bipes biporus TaxID=52188 RepID=Q66SI1_BIPBI|nr:NADH dehydrogenase subunit 6 [Bipes biporus]